MHFLLSVLVVICLFVAEIFKRGHTNMLMRYTLSPDSNKQLRIPCHHSRPPFILQHPPQEHPRAQDHLWQASALGHSG